MNDVDVPFKASDGMYYESLADKLLDKPMILPPAVLDYLRQRRAAGYQVSAEEEASFVAQFNRKYVAG